MRAKCKANAAETQLSCRTTNAASPSRPLPIHANRRHAHTSLAISGVGVVGPQSEFEQAPSMAKGRRYGSTYHDRLMGSYSYGYGSGPMEASAGDLTELMEEDVWSMLDRMAERENSEERRRRQSERSWAGDDDDDDDDSHSHVGGLSLVFQESSKTSAGMMRHFHPSYDNGMAAPSAPLNVPRWPRTMVGVESGESLEKRPMEGEDEDDSDRMPPHEYLAREYAQSRRNAAATSVFEGVGRTLKGRDMSRVRDAVWRRTGFDG